MADAAGGSSRRAEMERKLIQRSLEDEEFRRRLLDDPKGAVEQEIGTQLPQEIKIRVVEESPDIIYLVLPRSSPLGGKAKSSQTGSLMRWPAVILILSKMLVITSFSLVGRYSRVRPSRRVRCATWRGREP